jgi:hypothetical protein
MDNDEIQVTLKITRNSAGNWRAREVCIDGDERPLQGLSYEEKARIINSATGSLRHRLVCDLNFSWMYHLLENHPNFER